MDQQKTEAEEKKPNYMIIGILALALVAVIAGGAMFMSSQNNANTNSSPTPQQAMEQTPSSSTTAKSPYKNGEYNAMGDYQSPGGAEQIDVTLTLEDGMVKEVEVVPQATRPISKTKQADFAANYKEFVVGKNIDEVLLTKVSGSSLTPKGFNDAIEKIKVEAKS